MRLSGLNILLVEDEPIIAMDIMAILETEGASVEGPFTNVVRAMEAIERMSTAIDCAVLDYHLRNERSDPIARRLGELGVPVVFHTANDDEVRSLAEAISAQIVQKPSSGRCLIDALAELTKAVAWHQSSEARRSVGAR